MMWTILRVLIGLKALRYFFINDNIKIMEMFEQCVYVKDAIMGIVFRIIWLCSLGIIASWGLEPLFNLI